jgi:GNAT superfamily N-acetyltransferase
VAIKDVTALIAFFLGFVWAGPLALPYFQADLDTGDIVRALARFLTVVLSAALALGAVGLGVGTGLGALWEWSHKRRRQQRVVRHAHSTLPVLPFLAPPAGAAAGAATPAAIQAAATAPGRVRYTTGGIGATEFLALADRTCPMAYAPVHVAGALARTTNVGAWDEAGRLIGVARVLSDGDTCSVLRDIMVDPEWQRRGIGRALVERALTATPGDELVILAPATTSSFLESLGAERGSAMWLLRRPEGTRTGSGALESTPLPVPTLDLSTAPSRSARR